MTTSGFPIYEVGAPPPELFAPAVGGTSPVVSFGLLRRAVLQHRRLRAVAVAARHLHHAPLAEAGELVLAMVERDAFALNAPDVGAWVEGVLTLLTPAADSTVLTNLASSIGVSTPADVARAFAQGMPDIEAGIAADAAVRTAGGPSHIDISSLAARIDLPSVQRHPRLSSEEASQVTLALHEAQQLIRQVLPWLDDDRALYVGRIVPVPMHNGRLLSWTNSALLGAVFVTIHEDPGLLAEQLVHELSHSRLFLIQMIDELLEEAYSNESWTKASYYSPWRRDARPLNGILHGAFVFDAVATFWSGILQRTDVPRGTMAAARRRLGQVIGQLQHAHTTLGTHASFTGPGEAVFARLRHRMESMHRPLFETERLGEEIALDLDSLAVAPTGLTVNEQLARHRAQWEHDHAGLMASYATL